MKPLLLVIACILLLIGAIYRHRTHHAATPFKKGTSAIKRAKNANAFLPEARLQGLVY